MAAQRNPSVKFAPEIYDPVPMPAQAKIDKAAKALWNLASEKEYAGRQASFNARTLDFTGLWTYPADENLNEILADVPVGQEVGESMSEAFARLDVVCELEIRHAIERRNLSNMQTRELREATR